MANLLNTTISGTGHITPPVSNTFLRTPEVITTIVRWTTGGFTVLVGNTPTASASSWTCPTGVSNVEVLVVGGGGGGGNYNSAGGGGAGGVIYNANFSVTPGTPYAITVGAGGRGGSGNNTTTPANGSNSVFGSLTAYGGGFGSPNTQNSVGGGSGVVGSGGGGGNTYTLGGVPTGGQGNAGGTAIGGATGSPNYGGGGGGGAAQPGGDATSNYGGGGGNGRAFDISGTLTYYGGGGGGSVQSGGTPGAGGLGGGGAGGSSLAGVAGTANTGGGGGAGGYGSGTTYAGGAGGSGVVILRYKQTAAGTDIRGSLRYNTELTGLEVYENHMRTWTSQDETKNFAGHNLLTNSNLKGNDLGAEAIWTKTNNSTDVTAPDGSAFTTKCVSGTSGNSFFWQTGSITYKTNTTYTESVWVRVASGSGSIYFNNGVSASQQIFPTTTWQRYSFTYTTAASAGPVYYLGFVSPSLSTTFYFWGWQLEEGVTSPGPYTPTTTAPSPAPGVLGDYRIHKYTTAGTSSFVPACSGYVELLVVAGGGGGGSSIYGQGGAGAGGLLYYKNYPVTAGKIYSVSVAGSAAAATNGSPSWFGSVYCVGGGTTGSFGGCGGGGGHSNPGHPGGGSATGQGREGGYHVYSSPYPCGGGGGVGGPGGSGNTSGGPGHGGPGLPFDITGSTVYYGGGGGATQYNATGSGRGGIGGGGDGVYAGTGGAGFANTGGGGGAGGGNGVGGSGGAGGSGIVVVRYRYN